MCGIAGILYFNGRNADPSLVQKMNLAMAHRGPDADAVWSEEGIGLGHRRLSIIDLSTAANQPFHDNSKRFVTVFNGEIYNYQSVKKQLPGYDFKTNGDTETLVAAYAAWGTACLQHLKGMFAFAIWDREQKELCLVRDRMGVKPLYYYIDDEKIIFASEIRAILATGLVKPKLNTAAVYEYLSYQSVSFPLTMVEGIQQLEAGCWMKISNRGAVKTQQYWSVADTNKSHQYEDVATVKATVRQLLGNSIQQRLLSDVPVGAFLSGGIDSSIVVGLMREEGGITPRTFNISFSEKEFDESPYAEMVAKKFNADHTRIQLSPEIMLQEMENALAAMDTPSGDGINTYVVSKAIRQAGITVALSGIGGDELFAGYPIFPQFTKLHSYKNFWAAATPVRKLLGGLLTNSGSNKKSRVGQLLNIPAPEIEFIYPLLRQLITPSDIGRLTGIAPQQETALLKSLKHNKYLLHVLPLLSQVSAAEYMGYTQHTLLKDTDQMSMAVALEVREPFFDADLIEYVLGIPDAIKKPVYPKSLLVESVKPLLPDEIVFRKKQGFVFPWNVWLKNELYDFCNNKIHRLAERNFINQQGLLQYWNRFIKGDPSMRWMDVWVLVVLEYWLEKNGIE